MAERFSGFVVILEDDLRDEDAAPLMTAIGHLRGVADVRTVTSRPGLELVLRTRIRGLLRQRLLAVLGDADEDEIEARRVAW